MIKKTTRLHYKLALFWGRSIEYTSLVRYAGKFYMRERFKGKAYYFICETPDDARFLNSISSPDQVTIYNRKQILESL